MIYIKVIVKTAFWATALKRFTRIDFFNDLQLNSDHISQFFSKPDDRNRVVIPQCQSKLRQMDGERQNCHFISFFEVLLIKMLIFF